MTLAMTGIAPKRGGKRLRAAFLAPAAAATLVLGVAVTTVPAQAATSAAQTVSGVTVPISTSSFTGTLDVTRFVSQGGRLLAVGTLAGTVTNSLGTVVGTVSQLVTVPVTAASGTCTILTLDLGALHLNLLGVVVDLAPVHLTITAQQGPGNLLGNLLCAVANLLNGGSPLGSLAGLLNQILAAL